MRRFLIVCLLLVAGVFGLPAASAAGAPGDESLLVYSGTRVGPGPSGRIDDVQTTPSTLEFSCKDGVCRRSDPDITHPMWTIPITETGGSVSGTEPESGDRCGDDFSEGVEWHTSIDAEKLVAVASFTSDFQVECTTPGSSTKTYRSMRAYQLTWEAELVAGECLFSPERCGGSSPPGPTASADPTVPGAPSEPETPARTSSRLGTGDPAARSVVSGLVAPQELAIEPPQLLLAALLTIILVLLVAFPTSLLNSATEAGSDRFSAWWKGRARPRAVTPEAEVESVSEPQDTPAGSSRRGWWWAAAGVAAAGLISCFVDPQFGLNAGSVRMLASVLVGFAIDVILGWLLTVWLVRRVVPGASHSYQFKPVTLLVVVAAVALTRVTGFEPGIIFGLVAGVAFGVTAGAAAEGKAALTQTGYAFGAAVLAWLGYGALGGGEVAGDSVWGTFLLETLGSMAMGGMAALPIALFPLRGLGGHSIWQWNRWIWAASYAAGLLAFFVVLMPMPFSWQQVEWSLVAWVTVYVVYLAVALGLWLALARPWQRAVAGGGPEEPMP